MTLAEPLGLFFSIISLIYFTYFSAFLTMVLTQFKTRVMTIHSDNGGEFLSTHFKTLLHSYGIIHHRSCPYSPQQNGVVECKQRHLINTVRSLMFQASLPSLFWGHVILMATSIINRLPSSLLSWKTPFERLYQKPPTYDLLKVFGCLCFATMTRPDITFVLQQLSQHVYASREAHWDAALYLFCYLKLKISPSTSIFISSSNDLHLSAYCDADWASCSETRRSLTGYLISAQKVQF